MSTLVGDREYYNFELVDHTAQLFVEKISGSETMSELFEYSVDLVCEDVNYVFDDMLGKSATLTVLGDKNNKICRYVNGIIIETEYRGQDDQCRYVRVKLCPLIKLLAYKSDSRIFQDMTVQEIIQSVLKKAKLLSVDYSFSLQGRYKKKEYCVQYQESDLAFITRLMAEEGWFYYFDHGGSEHCLVIADNVAAYSDLPGDTVLRCSDINGYVAQEDVVSKFVVSNRVRSGAVSIADYDFFNPSMQICSENDDAAESDLAQFDYPGDFGNIRSGQALIKRRIESMQAYKKVLSGKSDCKRLQVGFRFALRGHPGAEYNQEYVIIKVEHFAVHPQVKRQNAFSEDGEYHNRFRCIPADIISRPQFKGSLRPIMRGIQTATVVGPKGEEIFTDEYGRVKVQFHWDRYGDNNELSSSWLRVSQSWAGNGWGAIYIPRVSQEVIVDFVDGDPDKPVITGCLYNANNMPPLALPKYKSISGIKCNTLKQGRGSNQFYMDDKMGESRMEISNAYGHKIVQDEKTQTLSIVTRDKHSLCMDDKNNLITLQTSKNHQIKMKDSGSDNDAKVAISSSLGHTLTLDDENKKLLLETSAGHKFVLDDKEGSVSISTVEGQTLTLDDQAKNISMVSKSGHSLVIDDDDNVMRMMDKNQEHQFSIDISNKKIVLSTSSGSIDLRAPEGEILLSSKDLSVEVSNNVSIKAGNNINTQAAMELSASANLVSTESTAAHVIKGMPVRLN